MTDRNTDGDPGVKKQQDEKLLRAVQAGNREMAEEALQGGASANAQAQNKQGWTALQLAAMRRDGKMITLLISHGAEPNRSRLSQEAPIMLLAGATGNGRPDAWALAHLLRGGADPNHASGDKYSGLPLRAAIEANDVKAVTLLLEHGASMAACDRYGNNAIRKVDNDDQLDIARVLIKHGADPASGDHNGVSALHKVAGREYCSELLSLYLDTVHPEDLNITAGDLRETPLHWAVSSGRTASVKALLARGARADGPPDADELVEKGYRYSTPLMEAVEKESVRSVELLVQAGADPYRRDKYGWGQMNTVLAENKFDCLKAMLPSLKLWDIGDLLVAAYRTHRADVKADRGGFRPFKARALAAGRLEETPGETADVWKRAWRQCRLEGKERRQLLADVLQAGLVDDRLVDGSGNTLLHHLCACSAPAEDIKVLSGAGADVNWKNNAGETPLLVLLGGRAPGPTKAGVLALLQAGAEARACDAGRRGAVRVLRENPEGPEALVKILLNYGAEDWEPGAGEQAGLADEAEGRQAENGGGVRYGR